MLHIVSPRAQLSRALTAALACAAIGLGACGQRAPQSAASTAASATSAAAPAATSQASAGGGHVLRIAEPFKPPASLDIASDFAFTLMNAGAVESLVNVMMDGTAQPALATQWRRTGETTWEFDLRAGVKFHDGTMLDADAVVTAMRYVMGVATPPRSLKGTGLQADAVDADTVRFTTARPDPILPLRLGNSSTAILAKAAYASSPANPIGFGTGPYKIDAYETGSDLKLSRFDDYWGGKPAADGVEVRFVTDGPARFNALKAGEIHIADAVAPSSILAARQDPAMRVEGIAMPRSTILMTNMQRGALKHLKIRQAIDLLIDKPAIVNSVLEGTARPAAGYFGDAIAWAPKTPDRPADYLEQAKKLIAESGVKPHELKLGLLTYTGRPELADAVNIIKSDLEKAGFAITVDIGDYTTVVEPKITAKDYDLLLYSRGYYYDMPDASGYFASDFGCEGSNNLNAFCDKAFDAIWQATATLEDAPARAALFAKAAQHLIDHKVGIPIYHDTSRRVLSASVRNAAVDPLDQRLITHETALASQAAPQ